MFTVTLTFLFWCSYSAAYVIETYGTTDSLSEGEKGYKTIKREYVDETLNEGYVSPKREYQDAIESRGVEACLSDCGAVAYSPYCGTDGVTYNSKCDLYNAVCSSKGAMDLKGKGECDLLKDQEEKDLNIIRKYLRDAMERNHPGHGKREEEFDVGHPGHKKREESCISDCSEYSGAAHCGSNGVTYKNQCEMYNAICASHEAFAPGGEGACGKKDAELEHPGHEKKDESCLSDCANYGDDPQCGSNGVTYKNNCEMYNAICKSNEAFQPKGSGPCGKKDYAKTAYKKKDNHESCISDCSAYGEDPQCGSNGNTYKNNCEMYNAICKSHGGFKPKSKGKCGKKDVEHPGHKKKDNHESCISDCSGYGEDPQCGSDGNTYKNKCDMYNAICKSHGGFKPKSKGKCGRKDYSHPGHKRMVQFLAGNLARVRKENERKESCMSDCSTKGDDPYCGSNSVTYKNKCEMFNAICGSKGSFLPGDKGACGKKDVEHPGHKKKDNHESCISDCSSYAEDPQCGSNGNTYKNQCEMYNAICASHGGFKPKSKGACRKKDENDENSIEAALERSIKRLHWKTA